MATVPSITYTPIDSVPSYTYTPFEDPEHCFRLLQILPECNQGHLHAVLTSFRRDAAPSYNPVSYTWGTEEPSSMLLIRDHGEQEWSQFAIRPNLEALLRQVRSSLGSVYIWVDAICINQADNLEKGHQVRDMHLIYRDNHLFVWLGAPSDSSTQAMDLIDRFWSWNLKPLKEESETEDFMRDLTSQAPWKALYDLVSRPWFSRRWIVQEFVLSGPKQFWVGSRQQSFGALMHLVIFLKLFPLRWADGRMTPGICYQDPKHAHPMPSSEVDPVDRLDYLWSSYMALCDDVWPIYKASAPDASKTLTLEQLLHNFPSFASYDPRDGIYAFISMACDINSSEWFPDYSDQNTAASLYRKVALHIMKSGDSLDIMARSYRGHNISGPGYALSTWFPWFGSQTAEYSPGSDQDAQRDDPGSHEHPQSHIHLVHGYNTRSLTTFGQPLRRLRPGQKGWKRRAICDGCDERIVGTGLKCLDCDDFDYCIQCARTSDTTHEPGHSFRFHNGAVYFASAHVVYQPTVWPVPDGTDPDIPIPASFAGFIVDRINHVAHPAHSELKHLLNKKRLGLPNQLMREWATTPGMENHINWDHVPDDALLRAMTGNRRVSRNGVSHVTDSWIAKARHFVLSSQLPSDAKPGDEGKRRAFEKVEGDASNELADSLSFMLTGRRLATTDQSLGFVPMAAEPGDSIAIILGCSVPLVIRRLDTIKSIEVWRVVGECYIEGLMEGEFIKKQDGLVNPQQIELI